jgi:membrane-associated phospholipid phosphatase
VTVRLRHRSFGVSTVSVAVVVAACVSSPCASQAPTRQAVRVVSLAPAAQSDSVHHVSPYLYPPHLLLSDRTYWMVSAGALVASGFLDRTAGPVIRGYRTPFLTQIAPAADVLGTANYTVPTITAALVAAQLSGNANWQDATRHITMSYILADISEALLKGGVGRQRPAFSGNPWLFMPLSFHDEWHSFPSGHVTHITAIAAALAQEAHRPWVTALSASAIAFTGWQRLYRNQHWASDVVGGVIVGTAASRVTAHWLRHKRKPAASTEIRGAPTTAR